VCDDRRIPPITVASGKGRYPADAEERVAQRGVLVPATREAGELGEPRAANAVVLGALSRFLGISEEAWTAAFAERLKARALAVNREAFARGQVLVGISS
jgi:indolepyruvate ferredoxin oxidoreductase beta subunit